MKDVESSGKKLHRHSDSLHQVNTNIFMFFNIQTTTTAKFYSQRWAPNEPVPQMFRYLILTYQIK